jgi:hypothetical protein
VFELVEVATESLHEDAVMPMREKDSERVVIVVRRKHPGLFNWGRLLLMMLSSVITPTTTRYPNAS